MRPKWEGRDMSNVRSGEHRAGKFVLERARPHLLQDFGAKLAFGDDIDQMVAGITATRTASLPAPKAGGTTALAVPPPTSAVPALPPLEGPTPAKVEKLKPRSAAQISRSHLHVVQPRHKCARFGSIL